MKKIGILDISIGNLQSLFNSVEEIGCDPIIINDIADIENISHLLIPGVGNFKAFTEKLKEKNFFFKLKKKISELPTMGICLGMQLFCKASYEDNYNEGLNFFDYEIKKINVSKNIRVPHVGWNSVEFIKEHFLFNNIKNFRDFYFTHSYYVSETKESKDIYGLTEYGEKFPSILINNNIIGVQFHPEKSQKNGLQLIENFCNWKIS